MSESRKVVIWSSRVDDTQEKSETRSALPRFGQYHSAVGDIVESSVDAETLALNLKNLLDSLAPAMNECFQSTSLTIEEVEMNLGLSANGSIGIIGKIGGGITASIKVKIKNPQK